MYVSRRRRKKISVYVWVTLSAIACGLAIGLTPQLSIMLR